MSKIGFIQDLVRGIQKIISDKKQGLAEDSKSSPGTSQVSENSLLERAFICLEHSDFSTADSLLEQVLNMNPKSYRANLGKLLVTNRVENIQALMSLDYRIEETMEYNLAWQFGDDSQKQELEKVNETISNRLQMIELKKAKSEKTTLENRLTHLNTKIKQLEKNASEDRLIVDKMHQASNKFFFFNIATGNDRDYYSRFSSLGIREILVLLFISYALPGGMMSCGILEEKNLVAYIILFLVGFFTFGVLLGYAGKANRKKEIGVLTEAKRARAKKTNDEANKLKVERQNIQKRLNGINQMLTELEK